MTFEEIASALQARFGAEAIKSAQFRDNQRLIVPSPKLFAVLRSLKEEYGFDQLAELTAADYLKYPDARDRFGVIYGLVNTGTGQRVWVKSFLNEPELTIASVFPLWKGADWLEREVYDMYGI